MSRTAFKLRPGFVYFLQSGKRGPIKIGFTDSNPVRRFKNMQAYCPQKLHWIACYEGTMATEQAFHTKFARYRMHGEWFKPSKEILDHLQSISPTPDNKKAIDALWIRDICQEIRALVPPKDRKARKLFLQCLKRHRVKEAEFFIFRHQPWQTRIDRKTPPTKRDARLVKKAISDYRIKSNHREDGNSGMKAKTKKKAKIAIVKKTAKKKKK